MKNKNLNNGLLLILLLFSITNGISQQNCHSISVYVGYSYGKPDKRIDFLYGRYNPSGVIQLVLDHSKLTTLDDEYPLGFMYRYNLSDRIGLGMGIGYGLLVQDFLLPANGIDFFGGLKIPHFPPGAVPEPLYMRNISHYHMLQIQPSLDLKLIKVPFQMGLNFTSISNFSFRKHIKLFNLSRNITEYFATEIYSGIYGEYKKIRLDIGYRLLHRKYRDDAIENNGLDPDPYNPSKWKFTISYKLWQSKA